MKKYCYVAGCKLELPHPLAHHNNMQIAMHPLFLCVFFHFYSNDRLKGKLPDDVKGRNKSHFCFFSSEGLLDYWQPRGTVGKGMKYMNCR